MLKCRENRPLKYQMFFLKMIHTTLRCLLQLVFSFLLFKKRYIFGLYLISLYILTKPFLPLSPYSSGTFCRQLMVRNSHQRYSIKKSCCKKFCNIHGKTPMLESLLSKLAGLKAKRDSNTVVFLWILRNFEERCFEEHLPTTAPKQSTGWEE